MDKNIGTIDQMVRVAGLFLAAALYVTQTVTGIIGTMVGITGIYFFMTALTQYSPIWEILGISTLKWKPFRVQHHVFRQAPESDKE